jgi:stalled ribosome rescue protein Dom34
VATLVGLGGEQASIWQIYSESVKPFKLIQGGDEYGFYESLVDALRPIIRQGVRGILVAAPDEKDYEGFMNHIRKHHGWLLKGGPNTVTFEHLPMPATDADQVRGLVKSPGFRERLSEVYEADIRKVMGILEKRLNDPGGIETLLFTLEEVEGAVYGDEGDLEYVLVTETFMSRHGQRVQRLLQVAINKGLKTKIVEDETPAGSRMTQFGGLVCMLRE